MKKSRFTGGLLAKPLISSKQDLESCQIGPIWLKEIMFIGRACTNLTTTGISKTHTSEDTRHEDTRHEDTPQ